MFQAQQVALYPELCDSNCLRLAGGSTSNSFRGEISCFQVFCDALSVSEMMMLFSLKTKNLLLAIRDDDQLALFRFISSPNQSSANLLSSMILQFSPEAGIDDRIFNIASGTSKMSKSNGRIIGGKSFVLKSFKTAIISLGGIKLIMPIILQSDLETGVAVKPDYHLRVCSFFKLLINLLADDRILSAQLFDKDGPRLVSLVLQQSRNLSEILSIDLLSTLLELVRILNGDLAGQFMEHLILSIDIWSCGISIL
jgi:hypothetical protein